MDPEHLISTLGTIGIFAIVFAESGLLVGFFLPGDALLFTAGLLASQGKLNLPILIVGITVAAIAGDQVGYAFGRRVGPALFKRPDSRFFKHENAERAQRYFDERGPSTIILARFMPIVRTFAPIVAGIGSMRYRTFVTYNIVGGVIWGGGLTTAGYVLGDTIPDIDKYLLPIIAFIFVASATPVALEVFRARRASRNTEQPD